MRTTTGTQLTDNDMEIMRILHNAFRRDAARLASVAQVYGTVDEETHDALLLGWHGFSRSLHHHHTIEDDQIWPRLRAKLADRPDELAVLDDMESEHSLIDPALEAVEKAFDDRECSRDEVAGRIDDLLTLLRGHLAHEEKDAFPLIRGWLTTQEWAALNKASELPPPLRLVHRFWWTPRYQRARRWG